MAVMCITFSEATFPDVADDAIVIMQEEIGSVRSDIIGSMSSLLCHLLRKTFLVKMY